MFKILLFAILTIYALWRITSFLGKITGGGSGSQSNGNRGGNVRVDNNPNKNKKDFGGGEYVDYEEVK